MGSSDSFWYVLYLSIGTIVCLDALSGSKVWRLFFKEASFKFVMVSTMDDTEFLNVCSHKKCIQIDPENGKYKYILRDSNLKFISPIVALKERGFAMVDSQLEVSLLLLIKGFSLSE